MTDLHSEKAAGAAAPNPQPGPQTPPKPAAKRPSKQEKPVRRVGSVTLGEVRMSSGLLFKTSRRIPTRWVSASARFSTPLLRRCRCCVLVLSTSGTLAVLPGISDADADSLLSYLQGG